jgi:hypothetical protein
MPTASKRWQILKRSGLIPHKPIFIQSAPTSLSEPTGALLQAKLERRCPVEFPNHHTGNDERAAVCSRLRLFLLNFLNAANFPDKGILICAPTNRVFCDCWHSGQLCFQPILQT